MLEPSPRCTFSFAKCLGQGGFGEVYRATMRSGGGLDTTVAVKVLRAELHAGSDAVRRLRDEGRLLAQLNHPSILKVFDIARLDGQLALVTEHVDGADLDTCLAASPPLSTRALVDALSQVAAGLSAAWEAEGPDGRPLRIVHRDLKPSNVRIGRHGDVRLLDFGIAHFVSDEREADTASDLVVGSVRYMAPERFFEPEATHTADVFGLGCLLFEGLAQQRYLDQADVRRLTQLALSADTWAAWQETRLALLEGQPATLVALCRRCLAHQPDDRPTASEFAERCDELLDALEGPSLRSWARQWPVSEPTVVSGALTGRTVVEDPLEPTPITVAGDDEPTVLRTARSTLDLGVVARSPLSLAAHLEQGSVEPPQAEPPTVPPAPSPLPPVQESDSRLAPAMSTLMLSSGCALGGLVLTASGVSLLLVVLWVVFG